MVQACQSEKYAPPFGIYIHESARSFAPQDTEPIHHVWMKWFDEQNREGYLNGIKSYFDWFETKPNFMQYNSERIQEHKKMAEEYFGAE